MAMATRETPTAVIPSPPQTPTVVVTCTRVDGLLILIVAHTLVIPMDLLLTVDPVLVITNLQILTRVALVALLATRILMEVPPRQCQGPQGKRRVSGVPSFLF